MENEVKKNDNRILIILGIIIIILFAIVIVLLYINLNKDKEINTNKEENNIIDNKENEEENNIIDNKENEEENNTIDSKDTKEENNTIDNKENEEENNTIDNNKNEEETTNNDTKDNNDIVLETSYVDIKQTVLGIFGSASNFTNDYVFTKDINNTYTLNGETYKFTLLKSGQTEGDLYINDKLVKLNHKISGITSSSNVSVIEAIKEDNSKDYYLLVVSLTDNVFYIVNMDGEVVNQINTKSNPIIKYTKNGKAYIMYWDDKWVSSEKAANMYDKYYFAIGSNEVVLETNYISYDKIDVSFENSNIIWWSSTAW